MPPSGSIEPIYYNSLYRHGVDEKRRVQIPAKWRPAQADSQFTLLLWPHGEIQQACLLVLPPELTLSLAQKLSSMPFSDPQSEALRRILGERSDRVPLDKAGRICLPEAMSKAVGVKNEVVLNGMFDRFQIWDPERYEASRPAVDAMAPEAWKLI